jgi:glycerophosphoryl diester phosphodiesterase
MGAAHIAAPNTLEGFRAARETGVEMIEFDVLSERRDGGGKLLLAHDHHDLRARDPIRLEEALEHLAGPDYAGIELDVDVKLPGYGGRVAAALRRAGLSERALVSCTFPRELRAIRALAPELRLGWSVPRAQRDYTRDRRTAVPAYAVLAAMRALYPKQARAALRSGRCEAIMAHWRLVTPALVAAVADARGQLFAWTVDEAPLISRIAALGVHGIITNDPRLFAVCELEARSLPEALGAPVAAGGILGGGLPDPGIAI